MRAVTAAGPSLAGKAGAERGTLRSRHAGHTCRPRTVSVAPESASGGGDTASNGPLYSPEKISEAACRLLVA